MVGKCKAAFLTNGLNAASDDPMAQEAATRNAATQGAENFILNQMYTVSIDRAPDAVG